MMIRLSYGSGIVLGLWRGKTLAHPTTLYVMVGERCVSNCIFCAQRRSAPDSHYLSRVLWPPVAVEDFLEALPSGDFSRICLQVLHYSDMVEDVIHLASEIRKRVSLPITANIVPVQWEDMVKMRDAGVTSLGIAIDAATPAIFCKVKGAGAGNDFTWEEHWNALKRALDVFGEAATHFIVGLGERDVDLRDCFARALKMGAYVGLFRHTPVGALRGENVTPGRYHAVQLMLYLLKMKCGDMRFHSGMLVRLLVPENLREDVERGVPFLTPGCPGCNRPFYTERPGGHLYNLPCLPEGRVGKSILNLMEGEGIQVEWV